MGEGEKTNTEIENASILETCSQALEKIFTQYYEKIGKKGYKFILSEEVGKISRMSEEDFDQFVEKFGRNTKDILGTLKANEK